MPHVRICAGGGPQGPSLPQPNDYSSFHVYTVAFVVPGFGYTATESPPGWVNRMVSELQKPAKPVGTQNNGGAQYDRALPFMWNSGLLAISDSPSWNPQFLVDAEQGLAQEIKHVAMGYPTNSLVDVNLIGHSRGTEVIAGASRILEQQPLPAQLYSAHLELTLLDPHPANNVYDSNESVAPTWLGQRLFKSYYAAQQKLHDPPIVIPSIVDYVSEYWQETSYSSTPRGWNSERSLNPWGLPPDSITIESPQETVFGNLQQPPISPPVGHSEVPKWYRQNVIAKLYDGPA